MAHTSSLHAVPSKASRSTLAASSPTKLRERFSCRNAVFSLSPSSSAHAPSSLTQFCERCSCCRAGFPLSAIYRRKAEERFAITPLNKTIEILDHLCG